MQNTTISPSLSLFSKIIEDLRKATAQRTSPYNRIGDFIGALSLALIMRINNHVHAIELRFLALARRYQTGTLRRNQIGPARKEMAQPETTRRRPARRTPPTDPLPRRYAWLVILMPHSAVAYGSQLGALLATPDMQALLAATPSAARILRPLARMLAMDLAVLRPKPAAAETPAPVILPTHASDAPPAPTHGPPAILAATYPSLPNTNAPNTNAPNTNARGTNAPW